MYMGAGCFGDTLLQTLFLPTYTWTWLNVCRVLNSSGCYWRFLLRTCELHAWTMWFWRSLGICHSHNFRMSFSWLNMSPKWLVQQVKTNSERKELCDPLVDQITQEIPIANSTLSPLLFHERSTTLQNDNDAHRVPFLWQFPQTHNFS